MKMFDVYSVHDISIVTGSGSWVYDAKGEKYLDMYGGHAVISIGHSNPDYVEAVTGQLGRLGFYSNSVVINQQAELAEALGRVSGLDSAGGFGGGSVADIFHRYQVELNFGIRLITCKVGHCCLLQRPHFRLRGSFFRRRKPATAAAFHLHEMDHTLF